jgi:uncharacterized protein
MGTALKSLLIIFYRNPEIGQVKTRLAATLGNKKALDIYERLTLHTKRITLPLAVDKTVYYSGHIDADDVWSSTGYTKALQRGDNLGERMEHAFADGFKEGYGSVCIVGTDCYELTTAIVERAFRYLQGNDAVVGPALDGGYYLLGMRRLHRRLFLNKAWSTDTVLEATLRDLESMGLVYSTLETLRDVDREDDVPQQWIVDS